jgi:hypothetical protein
VDAKPEAVSFYAKYGFVQYDALDARPPAVMSPLETLVRNDYARGRKLTWFAQSSGSLHSVITIKSLIVAPIESH